MSNPNINIDLFFVDLSILLIEYYYKKCVEKFPDLSNYGYFPFFLPYNITDHCPMEDAFKLHSLGDKAPLFLEAVRSNGYTVRDFRILQRHLILDLISPDDEYSKDFYNDLNNFMNYLDDLIVPSDMEEGKKYFISNKDLILDILKSKLNKQ